MRTVTPAETSPVVRGHAGARYVMTDYLGSHTAVAPGEQAYLVQQEAAELRAHFHEVDQFQVVVGGAGSIGGAGWTTRSSSTGATCASSGGSTSAWGATGATSTSMANGVPGAAFRVALGRTVSASPRATCSATDSATAIQGLATRVAGRLGSVVRSITVFSTRPRPSK